MAKVGFYNDNQYRDYPFIHQSRTGAFYELAQDAIVDVGFTLGPSVIYDPQKDSILLRSVEGAGGVLRYSFELFRSDIANRAGDKPLDHTAAAGIKLTFEVPAGTLPFTTIHDSVEIEIGNNVIDISVLLHVCRGVGGILTGRYSQFHPRMGKTLHWY